MHVVQTLVIQDGLWGLRLVDLIHWNWENSLATKEKMCIFPILIKAVYWPQIGVEELDSDVVFSIHIMTGYWFQQNTREEQRRQS